MAKLPWKPWHEVVTLREDLRTGKLGLGSHHNILFGGRER